jgi:soluble lytic murein transglycosylase
MAWWGTIRRSIISIVLVVLGACSTTERGQRPPEVALFPPEVAQWPINSSLFAKKDFESIDLFLSRVVSENPGQTTTWWADYRRGQLWSHKDSHVSCENMSRLAQEPQFPLNRLAFLRAHELCPPSNNILKRLPEFKDGTFDSWLSRKALDVAILKTEQQKKYHELIDLLLIKSKLNLPLEEKIELTRKALQLSDRYQSPKLARRIRQRLIKLSPSEDPSPVRRDYASVAQDYRRRRMFQKSDELYKRILNNKRSSTTDVVQAYMGLRTNFRVQQKRDEALAITKTLADYTHTLARRKKANAADLDLFVRKNLLLARNYWTEEQKSRALKILDRTEKLAKGKISIAELYWIKGRMSEEAKDFESAIKFYELANNEPNVPAPLKERVGWYKAWSLRKLGRHEEVVKELSALAKMTDDSFNKVQYDFWRAKSYQAMHEHGDAEDVYEDIVELEPTSYYGYLAHRELNQPLPAVQTVDIKALQPTKSLKPFYDQVYLEWLVAVREDEVARDYLEYVAQEIKKSGDPQDEELWTYLLHQYAKSNNYQFLFAQLQGLSENLRRTIIQKNPELLFPQPYQEFVADSANRFGLSVEFIYSIMRQESAFNPLARSHMDAFGLMQLLPQVAEVSAQENNIPMNAADDLYEPHVNIPLGSAHLRKLWDRYRGDLVLAVASYNASEKAILNWLNTRYLGDSLEFIEDIPYDETREYVKLVLRNLVTYQILTSREDEQLFPEWAIRIDHSVKPRN